MMKLGTSETHDLQDDLGSYSTQELSSNQSAIKPKLNAIAKVAVYGLYFAIEQRTDTKAITEPKTGQNASFQPPKSCGKHIILCDRMHANTSDGQYGLHNFQEKAGTGRVKRN